MELQPLRWALRLVEDDASASLAVLCVARDDEGRWLAGRRAPWLASWAGRWALGAGGAVEVGENPVETLARELGEEWSVAPERLSVEALVCAAAPARDVRRPGVAAAGRRGQARRRARRPRVVAAPTSADWPDEAHPALRRMATLLVTTLTLHAPQVPLVRALGDLHRAARARASPRSPGRSTSFGWAHGIGWIVMSLLCLAAVRAPCDPAVARRHGRGGRGPRAVRRDVGFVVCERRRAPQAAQARYGLDPDMAVDTTVEVVMPAMGESVTEGTILEWHKQEGDTVAADETLVEISTDKVDAEVPVARHGHGREAPRRRGRHRRRRRRARRDRGRRRRQRRRRRRRPPRRRRPRPRPRPTAPRGDGAGAVDRDRRCPPRASPSPRARSSSGPRGRRRGRRRRDHRRDLDRQGRHGAARARRRHDHRDPRRGGRDRHRRPGHRAHDRDLRRQAGRATAAPQPEAAARDPAGDARADPSPDGTKTTPVAARVAAAEGVDLAASRAPARAGASPRPTCSARATAPAPAAPPRPPPAAGATPAQGRARRCSPATWTSRARSRPRPRSARSPSPTMDGRRKQLKDAGQQGLLHAPDRLRDRAGRHRADAGDGAPLRRDRRQAARGRRRRRQPRHRRRRREEGRQPHADGAGHPRRRPPELRRVPGRLRRPDRPGARRTSSPPTTSRARTSRSPTRAASARSPPSRG